MGRWKQEDLDRMRRTFREIADKYYPLDGPKPTPTEPLPIPVERPKRVINTKSVATAVAETNATPMTTPDPKELAKNYTPSAFNKSDVKIPKTVASLIGTTVNDIEVLSYNREESLIPRGKKNMPLPHVNCKCKCGKVFVVNAYRVSGGQTKSCGECK